MDDRPEPLTSFVNPFGEPLWPESQQDFELLQEFERIHKEVQGQTAKRAEVEALVGVMDKHKDHFKTMVAARHIRSYLD